MQRDWWYSVDETRKGPTSIDAMRTMLLEGKLSASTLVWKEGLPSWIPLSEVAGQATAVRAVPPDLPRPTAREQLIALPLAGPWRRFFARLIDLWTLALPTAVIVALALSRVSPEFDLWIQRPSSEYAFGWLLMPFVLAVEAGVFAIFGNTLGKALLGVKVTTVGAHRPTAAQYARRQIGVYWYGFGTGFPLVSLFTMVRQASRLGAGRQARYDEGSFNVKAAKFSFRHGVAAFVVFTGLFAANVALQRLSRESDSSYYSGSTWTNEASGRAVSVPRGWLHERQQNEEKQPIHIFSGPDYGAYVVFGKEDVNPAVDLETYVDAWASAMRGNMQLSLPGQRVLVGGREAITITGVMTDDRSQRVRATLLKNGRQMWRVVILSTSGKEPASEQSMKLQELLFQSVD